MEVTVLIEGLMPYGGYTPVMAAVWETHAAGSIGRMGSPAQSNWRIGYGSDVGDARISFGNKNRLKLTPGKSEAAARVWIPALGHGQRNWPGVKDRIMAVLFPERIDNSISASRAAHPGLCTMSLRTRTASSLLMFSKLMSFT